jgi:hypothetical protein
MVKAYSVHGVLAEAYPSTTRAIDDALGALIDFDNSDGDDWIDNTGTAGTTSGRAQTLNGSQHLALIGTELVSFQEIQPETGADHRNRITGVVRGMADTQKQAHPAGTEVWYLGRGLIGQVESPQFSIGPTKYFTFLPWNARKVGDVETAPEDSMAFSGRAWKPYSPVNLQAAGGGNLSEFTSGASVTFSWRARLRTGQGAGLSSEDQVDASPTWEGTFDLEVWDPDPDTGTRIVNQTGIDALSQAVTITAANGVTARVRNRRTADGATYYSAWDTISVRKA